MSSQQDLQELLRLLTIGKVPIKEAMSRVKALQDQNLRRHVTTTTAPANSIQQIAQAPLSTITLALSNDAKAARSLHNACKARLKNPIPSSASKRAGASLLNSASSGSKRAKTEHTPDPDPNPNPNPNPNPDSDSSPNPSAAEIEASLSLPLETNETVIALTTLLTNRAPLLLAFATELLRFTMPEQPPSSRLSLAQAVISANSRSKAVAVGLEKGKSADEEGWGQGQPRVRVMGREVVVLKRGGYVWEDEDVESAVKKEDDQKQEGRQVAGNPVKNSKPEIKTEIRTETEKHWSTSSPTTQKSSRFIARCHPLTTLSHRQTLLDSLFATLPHLQTATHNAWALRVRKFDMFGSHTVREDSCDDGESGCGAFLLKLLRESNAIDVIVVLTRWYGGVMLGPDRWRIMGNCVKEALAERCRLVPDHAGSVAAAREALWGLDLEALKSKDAGAKARSYEAGVVGMPVHRPEAARSYLLRSFADREEEDDNEEHHVEDERDSGPKKTTAAPAAPAASPAKKKKTTAHALQAHKEENLARLLGAVRLLLRSWANTLGPQELDRRAWAWYTSVRPHVEAGAAGWGAKGRVRLGDILRLRRAEG